MYKSIRLESLNPLIKGQSKILSHTAMTCIFIFIFHFKFFIHGGPINQEWLLFRGAWKKPNYNATKIKKNIYNVKLE